MSLEMLTSGVKTAIDRFFSGNDLSMAVFLATLEADRIIAIPNVASTGNLSGFAYLFHGTRLTAADIGRSYTLKNLYSRGLKYDQGIDSFLFAASAAAEGPVDLPTFLSITDSAEQARLQLETFGCKHFEVQGVPPKERKDRRPTHIKLWSVAEILSDKNWRWLKAENANGLDVYVRPAPIEPDKAHPWAFIDDLNLDRLRELERVGMPVGILVESSVGNFHGWVRLGSEPMDRATLTAVCKRLAARFDTDTASADFRHYGRLTGFTNQKSARRISGRGQPFARLRRGENCIGRNVAGLIREVLAAVQDTPKQDTAAWSGNRCRPLPTLDFVMAEMPRNASDSPSHIDIRACMSLLARGANPAEIQSELEAMSARKNNPHDYAERTVAKAMMFLCGQDSPSVPSSREPR